MTSSSNHVREVGIKSKAPPSSDVAAAKQDLVPLYITVQGIMQHWQSSPYRAVSTEDLHSLTIVSVQRRPTYTPATLFDRRFDDGASGRGHGAVCGPRHYYSARRYEEGVKSLEYNGVTAMDVQLPKVSYVSTDTPLVNLLQDSSTYWLR
jgi:hypothetical protein